MEKSEIIKTARLAKIKLEEKDLEKVAEEFGELLDYFALLSDADLTDLDEIENEMNEENHTRSDSFGSSNISDQMLERAKNVDHRHMVINKVL